MYELIGKRYTRLTVIEVESSKLGTVCTCLCDCGNTRRALRSNLKAGHVKSCGCLRLESTINRNTKHNAGLKGREHPLYRMWTEMKKRCFNTNCKSYEYYGSRGITVCNEWRSSYSAFRDYMLSLDNCPKNAQIPGSRLDMEIDRYPNNDGNYEPGNVRWATRKQQMNNARGVRVIKIKGGIKMSLSEVVNKYGKVSYRTALSRINGGWPVKEAVTWPTGSTYFR